MMYKIKLSILTLLDIVTSNPLKISLLVIPLLLIYTTDQYIDKYKFINIHKINLTDGGDNYNGNLYLYKGDSYRVIETDDDMEKTEKGYIYQTYTDSYMILSLITAILAIIFILINLAIIITNGDDADTSWEFKESYEYVRYKILLSEIRRVEDLDKVYIILRNKILKESDNIEYVPTSNQLKSYIHNYIEYNNAMRDFKGTSQEIRESKIDEILNHKNE